MQLIPTGRARSSLRGDLFFNVGSQLLLRLVTAVSALYAARVFGPAQFGFWALLQVIFMYTAQAHFGTVNAMMRDVPMALARNDFEAARSVTNTTWTFVSICSVAACLVTAVGIWVTCPSGQPHSSLIVAGCGWLVLVQLQSVFFQFYCRAYTRFKLLAAFSTTQAVITMPLCLWLIPRWGIAGYLFALSGGFTLITVAILACTGVSFRWSGAELRRLLATGIPMLPGALILYLNMSIERIVLFGALSAAAVGIFVAGAFFFQVGGTVCELIVYTWYSRLAELYAESGQLQPLLQAFREIVPGALWISSLLQGAIYVILPFALHRLLPEYSGSIAVAQVLILTVNVWGIAQFLSFSLSIIGRQKRSAVLQCGFLVLKVALLIVVLKFSREVLSIAIASVIALLLYALSTFVTWRCLAGVEFVSVGQCFLLWAAPAVTAIACTRLSATGSPAIPLLAYVVCVSAVSILIGRKSRTFRQLYAWGGVR